MGKLKKALQMLLKDETKLNALVRTAFRDIDQDGSGEIDESELFEVLKGVSQDGEASLRIEDVKEAMAELDTYNNGLITFEEFKAMVTAALNIMYQREMSR
jgi:Ca2+-binding EF-hand superfamily protein